MDKKVLAEFTIEGLDKLTADTAKLIREQNELRASSKLLDKSTKEGSAEFVKQSNQLKVLGKEITVNNKLIQSATGVTKDLNTALTREVKTRNQAKASNAELAKLRDNINVKTKEGAAAVDRLNKKMDDNNSILKKTSSSLGKQKFEIGGYEKAIDRSLSKISLFGINLGQLRRSSKGFRTTLISTRKTLISKIKTINATSFSLKGLSFSFATASASAKAFAVSLATTGIGAFLVAAGAFVAIMGRAVKNSIDFAFQQSKLGAILNKNKQEMSDLRDLTKELGRTTEFTSKQVTEAAVELAKAGFSQNEIMKSLASTLNLASAGNLSLAEAADIASNVLSGFGLSANEATRVVDVLAKSSTSANVTVQTMGESFKEIASTASVLGVPIEEIGAAINSLGNSGIKGTNATNTLQSSLLRIADPTKKAKKAMNELNVSFFDVNGDFIGFTNTISTLEKSFENLTVEQQLAATSAIFGKNSANQWLTVLNSTKDFIASDLNPETRKMLNITDENSKVTLKGSEILKVYTSELENANGAASRLAKEMQDNLQGDITKLSSAWDGLLLTVEDGEGVFSRIGRYFTQKLTKYINDVSTVLRFLSFTFNDVKESGSLALGVLVSSIQSFGLKARLYISKIPIIGANVDVEGTESKLKEVEKLLLDYSKKSESRGSFIERFRADNRRIEIAQEKENNKKIEEERGKFLQKQKEEEEKVNAESKKQRDKRVKAAIDTANNELQIFILNNKSKLDEEKKLTEDLIKEEKRRVTAIRDARLAILEQQRSNDLISDSKYRLEKLKIEQQYTEDVTEIDSNKAEYDKKVQEEEIERQNFLKLEEFNKEIERLEQEGASKFEIQRAQIERDKAEKLIEAESEITNKEELERKKNQIERNAKIASEKIKKEETKVRVAAAEDAFGQIAQLLGEETAAGKAAAIAQATISTYQGVARVWEAPSVLPEPFGTAQKILSTGVVLKSGFDSVKAINKTPVPKAERGLEVSTGGLLQGKRHSQGGILIEAEGGEMIMNRTATSMFLPQLRQMQSIGNGNTGLLRQPFANDGGLVSRSIERANRQVEITNFQDIRVINDPNETLNVASEAIEVENRANI